MSWPGPTIRQLQTRQHFYSQKDIFNQLCRDAVPRQVKSHSGGAKRGINVTGEVGRRHSSFTVSPNLGPLPIWRLIDLLQISWMYFGAKKNIMKVYSVRKRGLAISRIAKLWCFVLLRYLGKAC